MEAMKKAYQERRDNGAIEEGKEEQGKGTKGKGSWKYIAKKMNLDRTDEAYGCGRG
jgi:hypothetical protein